MTIYLRRAAYQGRPGWSITWRPARRATHRLWCSRRGHAETIRRALLAGGDPYAVYARLVNAEASEALEGAPAAPRKPRVYDPAKMGKAGKAGGVARRDSLSASRRSEIARNAALVRWRSRLVADKMREGLAEWVDRDLDRFDGELMRALPEPDPPVPLKTK